jgi:uncharacterized protein
LAHAHCLVKIQQALPIGYGAGMQQEMAQSRFTITTYCPRLAMTHPQLTHLSDGTLAPICQRHGIRRLAVFGSRLKGTARPDSDLDMLVEFKPGRVPGLLGLSTIEIELTQALGLKVDLRTAQDLSPYFRDDVLQHAQVAYAG